MHPRFSFALILATLALPTLATSARQANFDAAERYTTERLGKMIGTLDIRPSWLEDEPRFWYGFENSEGTNWYLVDAAKRTKSDLFDRDALAARLTEHFKRPFNARKLDLKQFEYDKDRKLFTFHVDSIRFTWKFEQQNLVVGDSLEKEKRLAWASYSPDSTWIAFARKHDLYVMKADDPDSTEIRLTHDGERWYSYQADGGDTTSTKRLRSIARWFEDETKLYTQRGDNRKVKELWVINSLKKRPELETYKYAMPGDDDVSIPELRVFTIADSSSVLIPTAKWEDQNIERVYTEDKTSEWLWYIRSDRTRSKVDVVKANTTTGETTLLWSEESKPYFNWSYMQLSVINEGAEYLWWSERDGWGHLYRYGADGSLKNRMTNGYWQAGRVNRIDTLRQTVFFSAMGREPGVNPYYALTYRVQFDGTGLERLTPEAVDHGFSMGDVADYFVDTQSSVDTAPRSVLRDARGRVLMELETADFGQARLAGFKDAETFTVKAADGYTDLYGVMWKPFDFDSTKAYPIIAYVYPGPQSEPFPIRYSISGATGRAFSLAQVGFIVVAFGNRGGSPMRDRYYHTFGYGDLRDYPLADNKYGIEQLAARNPWIDATRVGIYGHSGGGFMSTAALLSYPDFYDVAVSSAGNHDNNIYNAWWSEVHNGVKAKTKTRKVKNGDGEEVEVTDTTWDARIEANPDLAGNLKGHLLLVHGDIDNNVHPGNTTRLVDALIKAGKRFDMMMLPGQRHGFGSMQPYFDRMTWYYFAEHLLSDYRNNVDFNIPKSDG